MQKTPIFLILAILPLLFSGAAIADNPVIYDSGPLIISTWHVHLSSHTFEASRPEEGWLVVTKDTPTLAIQAGFLILNGSPIPLTQFLTGTDASCRKPIALKESNRLRVFLVGAPGAAITIRAHAKDRTEPPPQVHLDAEPQTIAAGASSTLSWSSEHADNVTITPGIGAVTAAGAMTVTPPQTTTYSISATGPGGTASATATVTVVTAPTLEILYPPEGAWIDRPDVMVHGTFTSANAVGIAVNGKIATTWNGQFVVNHVPLDPGQNTLTVTATDANGHTQAVTRTVTSHPSDHHITLAALIESGLAPLELTLHLSGTFNITDSTLTSTGTEPFELVEIEPYEYRVGLDGEGITYFTAEVEHEGVTYWDTIAVVLIDAAEVDARLLENWADLKRHFSEKNIAEAVTLFDESQKNLYEELFTVLLDRLPQIAAEMEQISMIDIMNNRAQYRIQRTETHNSGTHTITHYIYFVMDEDGIWKIYRF